MEGWIKLHRKLLENGIIQRDHSAYILFSTLLLVSNRGKYTCGRFQLAELTGLKPGTVYKALKRLEKKWEMVTQVSNNKFTDISVINWDKYQSKELLVTPTITTKEQQSNNKVTLNKNKELKNKEINTVVSADQPILHKETTEFIDYFLAEYKRTQGRDFKIAGGWGRYIKQARPFIKTHGLETMKLKAHNYLISSDNWYQQKNFTLGLLLTDETINNL
jgi:hypothetical protein